MSALPNQLLRLSTLRLILWSLSLVLISAPRASAQNAEQPFDFEMKDGWPGCAVGGWHPWPGHWNRDPVSSSYFPPAASLSLAEDNAKLTYTVIASGGEGYRGDFLQIFESAPGAKFVVTAYARKTVWRKPNDSKAPPVEENYAFTATRVFNTLAEARAEETAFGADTLSRVPAPSGTTGNGTYLEGHGSSSVYLTLQADSWQLIAKAGTPQTIAGFPAGFNNNDNGMQGQTFTGEIPFDVAANQGRQVMMERWTLQVTAGGNFRLELQSLDPIDTPVAIPTAEVEPLVSIATTKNPKTGQVVSATVMTNPGLGWQAALGRPGCKFKVTAHSALSPITKVELQARPPGKQWYTLTPSSDLLDNPASKQKDYTQIVSVCLGDVDASKPMIPLDSTKAGVWSFQTITTNALGETAASPLADVNVVLPLVIRTVRAQTLAPAAGEDGGNGWFEDSAVKIHEIKLWTYGIPNYPVFKNANLTNALL